MIQKLLYTNPLPSVYKTVLTGWVCHAVARSSSAKTGQDCLDIDFAGIVPYDAMRNVRECLGDLATDEQLAFLKNSDNYSVVEVLSGFIDLNGCSEEMQNYLIEAIETVMNGGEVPCPEGYIKYKDDNCVEQPCPGDPVPNPEIAPQTNSGIQGGMFGNSDNNNCPRKGGTDCSGPRNLNHEGLDLKNPYGAPIFAMYDGVASTHYFKKTGYLVLIQSEIDGESISIQYFHMQSENRVTGQVSAGQIIGYQGDSGNLASGIKQGLCISHLHVKAKDSNNQPIDPRQLLGSEIDNNGNTTSNNNCN